MTRPELLHALRTMSSGTIASAIGSCKYAVIDRAATSATLYASEKAPDEEIDAVSDLADVLGFLVAHKDYRPAWCR